MQSIAKNEFEVINFLVRNFSQRYTIRGIAQNLNLSAAGVHSILKKLEKSNLVVHEKLGTGLFYSVNYNNKIARHLAAIVLLEGDVDIKVDVDAKAVIATKKDVLVITDVVVEDVSIEGKNVITVSQSYLLEKLDSRDNVILDIFKEGKVLEGEEFIVNLIKDFRR